MNTLKLDSQLSHLAGEAKSFADDLRGWIRSGVSRVTGAQRQALAERFAAWAEKNPSSEANAGKAELGQWIGDLDQQGREALTEQLTDFCSAFEIDLAWLVDGELKDWPQLESSLGSMVVRYCLACKAAVDADDELQHFRHRRVWQRKIKTAVES